MEEYQRAVESYGQSLIILRAIGDRQSEAGVLVNQAYSLAKINKYWEAKQNVESAREIYVELDLDHKVKTCDTILSELGQTIVPQPPHAPIIGDPGSSTPDDDWYQKSLPISESSTTSSGGGNQWIFYLAIIVVVVLLIVVLQ